MGYRRGSTFSMEDYERARNQIRIALEQKTANGRSSEDGMVSLARGLSASVFGLPMLVEPLSYKHRSQATDWVKYFEKVAKSDDGIDLFVFELLESINRGEFQPSIRRYDDPPNIDCNGFKTDGYLSPQGFYESDRQISFEFEAELREGKHTKESIAELFAQLCFDPRIDPVCTNDARNVIYEIISRQKELLFDNEAALLILVSKMYLGDPHYVEILRHLDEKGVFEKRPGLLEIIYARLESDINDINSLLHTPFLEMGDRMVAHFSPGDNRSQKISLIEEATVEWWAGIPRELLTYLNPSLSGGYPELMMFLGSTHYERGSWDTLKPIGSRILDLGDFLK